MQASLEKIMVIDDSEEDLTLLEHILKKRSFQVQSFLSGRKAFEAAVECPPDLIFLDINMPEMDGYEVCKLFQGNERLQIVPIIFLSARSSTEDKVRGFEAGGVDFISKPFQFQEVHARINTHLRIHELLKRQFRELEENYSNLRKLENMRDNLVHMIIHDMRSPLSAITGFLGLIKKDITKGLITEKTKHWLDYVIHSSDALTEMMNATLDVSKIEAGRLELHLSDFDLLNSIEDVVRKIYLPDSMPKLELILPEHTVSLKADRGYIERTIQNLLSNAFKFAPSKDGHVRLTVETKSQSIFVKIEDNGTGVPEAEKDNLFSKFWTGNAKKEGHRHSVGLGLAFCKMAIEAHQGSIGVEIPESSKGIAFWFEVPRQA